jgi:hypothetical protein
MDAKGLDKTHRDAVREIAARVLAQLHGLVKRGKITRIGGANLIAANLDGAKGQYDQDGSLSSRIAEI